LKLNRRAQIRFYEILSRSPNRNRQTSDDFRDDSCAGRSSYTTKSSVYKAFLAAARGAQAFDKMKGITQKDSKKI
jgi:hypothetical protein